MMAKIGSFDWGIRVTSGASFRKLRFSLFSNAFCLCFLTGLLAPNVFAKDLCLYTDEKGVMHQVNALSDVPDASKAAAHCIAERAPSERPKSERSPQYTTQATSRARPLAAHSQGGAEYLAKPEEIDLKGNIRTEDMNSSVGRIRLRWPRKVELLFGRTPQRAMTDAASTASRALKSAGFPASVQSLSLDWQVVFMDEEVPETQIPRTLITNCHPAWMTPPANLYVVSQRVAAGCGNADRMASAVADSELIHILLHEMGHAIEYQLLAQGNNFDRMRAEGFATWFEQYSSEFSSVIPKGSIKSRHKGFAEQSFKQSPNSFNFTGSALDYGRASMYFAAIVDRRGVSGLMQVYAKMAQTNGEFFESIKAVLGWDRAHLEQEVQKYLRG